MKFMRERYLSSFQRIREQALAKLVSLHQAVRVVFPIAHHHIFLSQMMHGVVFVKERQRLVRFPSAVSNSRGCPDY